MSAEHERASDELEIRDLIGSLARSADLGTLDEYLAVFADDAEMEIPGVGTRSGIDGLRDGAVAGRESGAVGPGSNTMHLLGASVIRVEEDSATSYTPFVMFRDTHEQPAPASAGRYFDEFTRTTAGWRFRSRKIRFG